MSRVSRVPYHQNVYDLLQVEPSEPPQVHGLIAEPKWRALVPASVLEWHLYLQPVLGPNAFTDVRTVLRHSNAATYLPGQHLRRACVARVDRSWFFVALDGADDPAVLTGNGVSANHANWTQVSATFSEFAYGAVLASSEGTKARKERSNLWLRTPAEPLCPPVIDCLIERFGEPEVTPRPGNVSTYAWRPTGGTVRVTADEPTLAGGLSAWWVHAKTPERLAEFARLLLPWGTLRDTLRADTEPAQDVLKRAREV